MVVVVVFVSFFTVDELVAVGVLVCRVEVRPVLTSAPCLIFLAVSVVGKAFAAVLSFSLSLRVSASELVKFLSKEEPFVTIIFYLKT